MTIKLYTKTVCPKCSLVKSMLTAMEVPFETFNIDEDNVAKKVVIDAGFMSVPVVDINGELIGDIPTIQSKVSELV